MPHSSTRRTKRPFGSLYRFKLFFEGFDCAPWQRQAITEKKEEKKNLQISSKLGENRWISTHDRILLRALLYDIMDTDTEYDVPVQSGAPRRRDHLSCSATENQP